MAEHEWVLVRGDHLLSQRYCLAHGSDVFKVEEMVADPPERPGWPVSSYHATGREVWPAMCPAERRAHNELHSLGDCEIGELWWREIDEEALARG